MRNSARIAVSKTEERSATPGIIVTELSRWEGTRGWERRKDVVVMEEPLEIRVRGQGIAVTMRTPGHDNELAVGFLLAEGVIRQTSDVVGVARCLASEAPDNTLNVFLSPALEVNLGALTRHVFASSSCGLCGKASIEAVHQHFAPVQFSGTVPVAHLGQLPLKMRELQENFAQTGGLHAAAIFQSDGQLVVLREDVGRHNAVDKVIGFGLLQGQLPYGSHVLVVSGRASFEIMQKALAARIPIVCAVSAPSSLAVEFARESGQTLVGFLRSGTMNVYCGESRLVS